jgi:hypothetical protein
MKKLLALLTFVLVADIALADVPPPPPPKGKKYVSVNNEVLLGKDVTGYVFVQSLGGFGPGAPGLTYKKLELSTEKATEMPTIGRRTFVSLIAVPQDAAKEFKTDDDLFAAIKAKKVKGTLSIAFNGTATVSDKVKENSVKWTHTITAIDAKGIKTKVEGAGIEPPVEKPKKDSPQDDADAPTDSAQTPRGGMLIAGVAAFAAIMLGGLWFVGRTRRKP